jgi:signal transduction histidine kinase
VDKSKFPMAKVSFFGHRNPETRSVLDALFRLQKTILYFLDYNKVIEEVVNSVFQELGFLKLGYEIVVLCLIDPKDQTLKRISVSQTKKAKRALELIPIPFHKIAIPLTYKQNLLIKAINTSTPQICTSWPDILLPSFTKDEALTIQQKLGIKASIIYPFRAEDKPLGTLILSMNKPMSQVSELEQTIIDGFSNIVGLAVQNASLYSQIAHANHQLKKANRHLKHLDKLKDEFVFIATHELKNPVTAMRGYLSMIQEGSFGVIPETMKDPVNQLQSSNQQLVELVNDLLQIARAEAKTISINTVPVKLCEIAEVVLESVMPLAKQKGITLKHECLDKKLQVMADENRLKEILNNLVSNAIKYSTQGTISISYELKDKDVLTHVQDQGVGIPEKDQAHIFTRFFRVEEEMAKGIPGTGLGLFIVKQLIEKMGGNISFKSIYGQGTTFSFSLPKAG